MFDAGGGGNRVPVCGTVLRYSVYVDDCFAVQDRYSIIIP